MTTCTPERIRLPSASLSWRTLRGPEDYRVLANIGQRANLADHVDDVVTAAEVASDLARTSTFDPSLDVLIAEIEGRPVAWQWTVRQVQAGQSYYMLRGYVSPGWRRRGIGRAMLRRGERHLRQVAALHPAGQERFFATFSPAIRVGKVALFESEGYQPIRHFYTMLRDDLQALPSAPLPAGFELRPARPEHWRAIWEANAEAFRDHWGNREPSEEDFQRLPAQADFDPSLWQVAWHTASSQVAGVAINVIPAALNRAHHARRGVVENLSVRRPWRKLGLGRALLVASLAALRARGQTEVRLGVDAENMSGALRLYEAAGFKQIEHGIVFIKPLETLE